MLENGQVHVSSMQKGKGRPKELLTLTGDYCHCIGIDLGGTHITTILLDFTTKVLASQSVDLNENVTHDTILSICDFLVENLLNEAGLKMNDVSGIGVTFPGIFDTVTGDILTASNLPSWKNISVKKIFEKKYNIPVSFEDCSRAMALAELWHKNNKCDNFIVLDMGLGIGCGIVIDNKIYAGSGGKSGEIGHMITEINGPVCSCGRRGCIETLASGWALSKRAQELLNEGKCSELKKIIPNSKYAPHLKEIILAAGLGDESCKELLTKAGEYIGIGIANALSLFNPSKVILGGRMIKDNSYMLKSIDETVRKQTIADIYNDVRIEVSDIGDNASAIGAAILCIQQHYQ